MSKKVFFSLFFSKTKLLNIQGRIQDSQYWKVPTHWRIWGARGFKFFQFHAVFAVADPVFNRGEGANPASGGGGGGYQHMILPKFPQTLADLRGCTRDVPPPGSKLYQFHAVFWKIWQNNMSVPPWRVGAPTSG